MFANAISNHQLKLISGASHNFTGQYEEIVDAILEYFAEHERNAHEKGNFEFFFNYLVY